MSRFFDIVSKPARSMGTTNPPGSTLAALENRSHLIKLDSNENPFGPSASVVDAMRTAISAANLYPDDDCSQLRRKLAEHHGLPPEQVLVTAGSTALLSLLCQTLLAPGLNAVTSERSFIVYSMAVQAAGGRLLEAAMRDDEASIWKRFSPRSTRTRASCFWRTPTIPPGTLLEAAAWSAFWRGFPVTWLWFWMRLTTSSRCISRRCGKLNIQTRWITSPGRERGCAANFFQSARTRRVARGLRPGSRGIAGILRAHAQHVFGVVGGASGGAWRQSTTSDTFSAWSRTICVQSRVLAQGLSALGYRVVPTSANLYFLRSRRRCRGRRQALAG
jgi:hypothetical protein